MCGQTKTALKVLLAQPDRGGLSEAAALVFESVIGDTAKMEERMTKLEEKVMSIDSKVDAIDSKLDSLLSQAQSQSWFEKFWNKYGDKIVIGALLIAAAVFCKQALPELVNMWKALV